MLPAIRSRSALRWIEGEALPGADFVTTQLRVGGLAARIKDERIPDLHHMLGQETNGAGGVFKALRTIPVIGQIIDDMARTVPRGMANQLYQPQRHGDGGRHP